MSAGFKIGEEVFWGTNGAVEAYLEALAAQGARRFGVDDRLAAFLRDEREGCSMGRVVYLDEWLEEAEQRARFLQLLDAATEDLLREGLFTDSGRHWVDSVIAELRRRIAGEGNAR